MLRPRLRTPRTAAAAGLLQRPAGAAMRAQIQPAGLVAARARHNMPTLDHFSSESGVPGLLSPGGFDIAWNQYMHFVTDKLNDMTDGTEYYEKEVVPIIKETARQPDRAALFNYASMAHNNAFFFRNLRNMEELLAQQEQEQQASQEQEQEPAAFPENPIPSGLRKEIVRSFGSVETLRREMLATADAMFGPGFVWLVKDPRAQEYRILVTYQAGTPYTAAHWRRQGVDLNSHGGSPADDVARQYLDRQSAGAGSGASRFSSNTSPGGADIVPLLCVNTWEHVWLRDYGVGVGGVGGKRDYLARWWDCVDWNKVEHLADIGRKNNFQAS